MNPNYGNKSPSRSHRRSQDIESQEPLAIQSAARPPSKEPSASKNGGPGSYSVEFLESQEGLATQHHVSNICQNVVNATHPEPTMLKTALGRKRLAGILAKGSRLQASPEQQPKVDSTQRPTKETPSPGLGPSTLPNKVVNGCSVSEKIIHGTRYESAPEQQSQSSHSSTSSHLGTHNEDNDQENGIMASSQSNNAGTFSQSQLRASNNEAALPSPDSKISSGAGLERTDMNIEDEITSFQARLPSSSLNTAPMVENGGDPVDSPKERPDVNRRQSNEPARKEKSFHRDPWSNMRQLRRRDVEIPPEQQELLDRDDCWIPPNVGHPYPQGHVPPNLLQEWNSRMIRLFDDARRTHASSQKAQPTHEQEVDPSRSSKHLSDKEDDADSDANSEISWSESDHENQSPSPLLHLRKGIAPPDSSPIQPNDKRKPTDTASRQINGTVDLDVNSNFREQVVASQPASQISEHEESTKVPDVLVDDFPAPNSNSSAERRPVVQLVSADPGSPEDDAESSDDSDREQSVPPAVAVNPEDISSQIVLSGPTALTSSGSSSAPAAQVQILNTPAADSKCTAIKIGAIAPRHLQEWAAQQGSSDNNQTFSQMIANSLDSTEGSSGQEHQSQDAQRPLIVDSQMMNDQLHASSHSSHQDSQHLLEAIPESSPRSRSQPRQVSPQRQESAKERVENDEISPMVIVSGNPLKRGAAEVGDLVAEQSPSKRAKKLPDRAIDASRTQIPVDIDEAPIESGGYEHASLLKKAVRVYDMFKRSYPKYAGNFDHFQSLCVDLLSLKHRGILTSPILWDDFIMRHWVDYGSHVQKCITSNKEYESYEDFFCRHYTKPSFRKRNLIPRTLEVVVSSKLETIKQKPVTVERGMQTNDDIIVGSASVIHHSALAADQGPKPTFEKSNSQSTSTSDIIVIGDKPHQANIGVKMRAISASPRKSPVKISGGTRVNLEPITDIDDQLDGKSNEDENNFRAREDTPYPITPDICATDDDDVIIITPERLDDDNHHTASTELNLEISNQIHHEDENENDIDTIEARLEQISRMRRDNARALQALFTTEVPDEHVEEDANTPFKTWARDDHNVVSERRRRGGYNVPLDENGNIVVEEFEPLIEEGGEKEVQPPFRRWFWPRLSDGHGS